MEADDSAIKCYDFEINRHFYLIYAYKWNFARYRIQIDFKKKFYTQTTERRVYE